MTATGLVQGASISGLSALSGATVAVCIDDCTGSNNLATETTNGSGEFTAGPFTTNGTAIPAYLTVTDANDETTLAYPGEPMATDTAFRAIMFPTTLVSELGLLGSAGCTQDTTNNGIFGVLVEDCNNQLITSSATISVTQNGTTVGDPPISAGALGAAYAGLYLVCNVPPGTTEVNAMYGGDTFLSRTVLSVKGEATETAVRPGY